MNYTIGELKEIIDELEYDWNNIGIRFEEKEYQKGEIISDSKHNGNREDEREFPSFGTEDYEKMSELPGVSTYNTSIVEKVEDWAKCHSHCYLVVSNGRSWYDSIDNFVLDDDELVIEDGQIAIIIK